MPYESQVIRRATNMLEQQVESRRRARANMEAEVRKKAPRVMEIESILGQSMAKVLAAALREGDDPQVRIQEIRRENLALQEERHQLIAQLGYPKDCLDEVPQCSQCNDSGWQGSKMCQCLAHLCGQVQIEELSSLLRLGEQSFHTFSYDWYSSQRAMASEPSPRENMESIYNLCVSYARNFISFPFPNLLFYGSPGLGKTFLSACIARVVAEAGHSVVYDSAVEVLAQFEIEKFSRDSDDTREARADTRRYLGCDLLILDDLGSEMTTNFVQSTFYRLINTRLTSNKRTIISTNLSPEELRQRYTNQLHSRLVGEYHLMRFYGEDIRIQKKQAMM